MKCSKMKNSFRFQTRKEKEAKKKMIYGFMKVIVNFFRDFFADLFSIFKDDQSSIGEDDLRWRTVESQEFSRQTGQSL